MFAPIFGFLLFDSIILTVLLLGTPAAVILIRLGIHFVTIELTNRSPANKHKPKRDGVRELAETIVFVVVLVLMLKLFVVEAFVIPTGSMAETLYGYHKEIVCEQCGYDFDVNASREVEGSPGQSRAPVAGYCCPNCRFTGKLPVNNIGDARNPYYATEPSPTSGDRVLVHKVIGPEARGNIVVFKYPEGPQSGQVAINYIKRCVAFGGETVAVHRGELFITKALQYPEADYPRPSNPNDLWKKEYTYHRSQLSMELFEKNKKEGFPTPSAEGYELFRKPDDLVMSMRRAVYDNDFQPKDLNALGVPPRWRTEDQGWQTGGDPYAKVFKHTGPELGKLKYQHNWVKTIPENQLNPMTGMTTTSFRRDFKPGDAFPKPTRITNFMGYNAGATGQSFSNPFIITESNDYDPANLHWVGDLMVECRAKIDNPESTVILDLARGPNRYQAEFAGGQVKLLRTGPNGKLLATRSTPLTKAGTYDLRFANVDCRLRVWVNGTRIDFGTEADYPFETPDKFDDADHEWNEGWFLKTDILEPVAIRVQGEVELSKLVIWRDTYYTGEPGHYQTETYYVQPGHYLCFGDNSSQSSDSRTWGVVPERLMLGRAVFTFYPFNRFGFIR